jgi:diguanylate cyclase (GGDEF)-like protein
MLIKKPFFYFVCVISIGISVIEPHSDNNYQMFEEADKALYIAKSSGRNQICMVSTP